MINFDEDRIRKSFVSSVADTFAKMAYIDVILENDFDGEIVHTSIMGLTFEKPGDGSLFFCMTKECKKRLVENIYGEDWSSLNDMEIDDCLLEILNVLTGDFIKKLYGKDEKVSMSFPKLYFDDEELPLGSSTLSFIFNAEGAMFSARVWLAE